MNLLKTETSSYEIFDSNDLDRMTDVVAKAFTNSDRMAIALSKFGMLKQGSV
jgi:hypothetical protein